MTKVNKQWLKNLFIKSSVFNTSLIESLRLQGQQAYFLRDYAQLRITGERLINLSHRSEDLGRYYRALANGRQWQGDKLKALTEFESLQEQPQFRAGSLICLAGFQIASGKITGETTRLLIEASAISRKNNDVLSFINAQSIFSVFYSNNGDHKNSLNILRGLQKAVDNLDSTYDVVKSDFYNSVSYELLQMGNIEASMYFIRPALNSLYLSAYPEWQETANEITQASCKIKGLQIFVPYCKPENVVDINNYQSQKHLSENLGAQPKTAIVVYIELNNRLEFFGQVELSGNAETSCSRMQNFLFGIDKITLRPDRDEKSITVIYYYCSNGSHAYMDKESIDKNDLLNLENLINQTNELETSASVNG